MTAPSPPRKTAWFPRPPRWSVEEDFRSYPHHQNNLDSNISCKTKNNNFNKNEFALNYSPSQGINECAYLRFLQRLSVIFGIRRDCL